MPNWLSATSLRSEAQEHSILRWQVALAALMVALIALWTSVYGVPKSRLEVAAICVAIALVLSGGDVRAWGASLARVWLPFFGLLGMYDVVRGYADETGRRVLVMPQLRFDEALFGGANPTIWMQQRLWTVGNPQWWDVLAWVTYLSHFFVPFGIVLYLWHRHDRRFPRYMGMLVALTLSALATYLLVPAVPPWMASNMGQLEPTTRIVHAMWSEAGASAAAHLWSPDAPHTIANQVAALPSLHAALPMLICLFFWPGASRLLRAGLAAYPLLMGWALVYGAEHYVFDVLLGWAYAAAIVAAPVAWAAVAPRATYSGFRIRALAADRPDFAALAGAAALALLLRLPTFRLPLGVDEGGTAFIARAWLFDAAPTTAIYHQYWFDRPPLLMVVMGVAGLGGDVGVRVAGAICAAGSAVVVGMIAREIARSVAPSDHATHVMSTAVAAFTTAALLASPMISGVRTDSLLVGLVPASLAVLCALRAMKSGSAMTWFLAGLFAATALLCKQSFFDAGLVVAIALLVCLRRAGVGVAARGLLAASVGMSIPLAATLTWIALEPGLTVEELGNSLFASRVDVLHALSASELTPVERLVEFMAAGLAAGIVIILTLVPIAYLRRTPPARSLHKALTVLVSGWFVGGLVCLLAGGYYWPHYWIQLVPVIAVLAAVPIMCGWVSTRGAMVAPLLSGVLALGGTAVIAGAATPMREGVNVEQLVGRYVRANAQPGDSIVVVYSRANVAWYADLPSTSPYLWSSAYRALPTAQAQLRQSLDSTNRPTWIVQWQSTRSFGLDRDGRTRDAIDAHYRSVGTLCGHPILVRRDQARVVPGPSSATCPLGDLSDLASSDLLPGGGAL